MQFYVVTEKSLYILNGVIHTAVKETIYHSLSGRLQEVKYH